jgi:hypothetical protein
MFEKQYPKINNMSVVHNTVSNEIRFNKFHNIRTLMKKNMGNMYRWKPLEASLRKALREKHE